MSTSGQDVVLEPNGFAASKHITAAAKVDSVNAVPRPGAQYFDTILWRLRSRMELVDGSGYLLGITGCGRRAGVSTVAANLAIRAADQGISPVLLVDANFQNPFQKNPFRTDNGPGLADVLTARVAVADAIHTTKINGLALMPVGREGLLGRVGIDPENLTMLLKQLRRQYQLIVFDLPDAHEMQHGLLFAAQVDAALLVIRAESVQRSSARIAMSHLLNDGVNVIGAVVTDKKSHVPQWLRRWL